MLLIACGGRVWSQPAYGSGIVGYENCVFKAGNNLFNNSLLVSSSNFLSDIFFSMPVGTTVSLWNSSSSTFDTTSTFSNGAWSVDFRLPPGTGALVDAPRPFTNTVVGVALNHDGSMFSGEPTFIPPPVFSSPDGLYLLGDKAPVIDVGTNIFLNIIGRMPFVGEQVITLNETDTYLGEGLWDSVPTLEVGQAAFIRIKTEPPPWLTIIHANNQTIVSWPSTTSVWTLQTNSSLANGAWGNYSGAVVNNTVTNPISAGNMFYRLSYP